MSSFVAEWTWTARISGDHEGRPYRQKKDGEGDLCLPDGQGWRSTGDGLPLPPPGWIAMTIDVMMLVAVNCLG